jgi:hypothetical protein
MDPRKKTCAWDKVRGIGKWQINSLIPGSKRQSETLTPGEYDELLRLSDQVEKLDAERVEYLKELAGIRQTSLTALMKALQIQTPT